MLNFTKVIFLDFLTFLKNPTEQADAVQTRSEKAKKLFTLLLIDLPVMGVLIAVLSGMEKLGLFNLENNKMTMLFLSLPIGVLIFILVLLIPLFEELIFRLYLRYKYNYILRFLVFTTSITGKVNHEKVRNWVDQIWVKRYKVILYFSAILFGLVHLTNYMTTPLMILFSPIVVAPQIVAGLFLGYLRVRHGVFTGFVMHAMHNAIFICIPLLFMGDTLNNIEVETKAYTMEFGKSNTSPDKSFIHYFKDSVTMNHVSMKTILTEVLNKDEMLIKSNNESFMNISLDLKIKTKRIDHTADRKDINYEFLRKSILDQLSKSCGFRIINEKKTQEVWELWCVDSVLLAKHVNDSIYSNRVNIIEEGIKSSNTSMWHLAKALSQACNKFIVNKTGSKQKFAVNLKTTNFKMLQRQLSTEYGLSLKKSERELEFTRIEF